MTHTHTHTYTNALSLMPNALQIKSIIPERDLVAEAAVGDLGPAWLNKKKQQRRIL